MNEPAQQGTNLRVSSFDISRYGELEKIINTDYIYNENFYKSSSSHGIAWYFTLGSTVMSQIKVKNHPLTGRLP
jgi:hypothetical protein